ncbi:FAD-dependent oxidoreductase [Chloroflexota bacterium]
MPKIVVIGGGLSGCAAAAAATKAGAKVTLLERMEMLGGCGLYAGILSHEGYCFDEELRLMGCNDICALIDGLNIHRKVYYPWPKKDGGSYKDMYNVTGIDTALKEYLERAGVEIGLQSRAIDVQMEHGKILSVTLDNGKEITGDIFIDATGGAGPIENCRKYGTGCAMCFFRCPAFGGRVSIAAKAGVKELKGRRPDGAIGPTSAGTFMVKHTLSRELMKEVELKGVVIVPIPKELVNYDRNKSIGNSANVEVGYAENIVLADIGAYAKRVAAGWAPLDDLRKVPGFEQVRYADPTAGTIGTAIRFMALTPRDEALKVPGVDNLFVASEKLGLIGLVSTITAGTLAGHNAVRSAVGVAPLVLPTTTLIGFWLKYINDRWDNEGLKSRVHIRGPFLDRAKEIGLYTLDKDILRSRIEELGLMNILSKTIVA